MIQDLKDFARIASAVCMAGLLIITLLSTVTVTSQCITYGVSYCQRWETTIKVNQ